MTYAKGTTVAAEKSRGELDRMLSRAGATQRLMGVDDAEGFAFVGIVSADDKDSVAGGPEPRLDAGKHHLHGAIVTVERDCSGSIFGHGWGLRARASSSGAVTSATTSSDIVNPEIP